LKILVSYKVFVCSNKLHFVEQVTRRLELIFMQNNRREIKPPASTDDTVESKTDAKKEEIKTVKSKTVESKNEGNKNDESIDNDNDSDDEDGGNWKRRKVAKDDDDEEEDDQETEGKIRNI